MLGRGFDNDVALVDLVDGDPVVLRRFREPRAPEGPRAAFLDAHQLPAPRLLASAEASLVEFVPGRLLGDLIETGDADDVVWRAVGCAYRQVHDVVFPPGLAGELRPDGLVLRPLDPVAELHAQLETAVDGLARRSPATLAHLPRLHQPVDAAAEPLRQAGTALGHGDINMWNVVVEAGRATLIDWDSPRVGDPAMEVALLDKHAALFNHGAGLPVAFFAGYGARTEPNTSVHRVVQTVHWVASDDWDEFAADPYLPDAVTERALGHWLPALLGYLEHLPMHLDKLHARTRS